MTHSTHEVGCSSSAVSWPAIFAGAVGAAALSLILLILGVGLGFSAISPWADSGAGVAAVGIGAIFWLTLTQILASGLGGFLAARLRSKWLGVDADETFFRDSAHGFLAWAVATLLTVVLLSSAVSGIIGAGAKATGAVASGAALMVGGGVAAASQADGASSSSGYMGYYIDSLFRQGTEGAGVEVTSVEPPSPQALAEVTRIFANALANQQLPEGDAVYLGEQISIRTNLGRDEAIARVKSTFTDLKTRLQDLEQSARESADAALKASTYTSLWLFISLLIGAFVAAFVAARTGSCQRCCTKSSL